MQKVVMQKVTLKTSAGNTNSTGVAVWDDLNPYFLRSSEGLCLRRQDNYSVPWCLKRVLPWFVKSLFVLICFFPNMTPCLKNLIAGKGTKWFLYFLYIKKLYIPNLLVLYLLQLWLIFWYQNNRYILLLIFLLAMGQENNWSLSICHYN